MPYETPYADPALYDVVYSKIQEDIPFYVSLAAAARGPVLEVGCGTGRVLIPSLQAGADIDGLDLDPGMLAHLQRKTRALGLEPRLVRGDMRDFTMPRRYGLVTLPFRTFMHMVTTDDQLRALRCMREHLEPGGSLAFNLFYPSFDSLLAHEGQRRLSIEVAHPENGGPVAVYDISRYDRVNQQVRVEREIVEGPEGAPTRMTRAGFLLRWTYRFEMELLLRAAGFLRWTFHGGFDRRPLEKDTDEMLVLAWKD